MNQYIQSPLLYRFLLVELCKNKADGMGFLLGARARRGRWAFYLGSEGEGWGGGFQSSLRARSLSQAANLLSLPCRSLSPGIPEQPSSGLLDQIEGWDSLIQGHMQPYWNLKQHVCVCTYMVVCVCVCVYIYMYI